ncbi:meiotic coiled-coil protein [Sodiomyces alkalinus F11]|uniref:Meiotic coiled-coil protein n=1 Tax=Sodiomyces alkalinus (strain CBS 110278 / VKM F-3762 / F11) TaxID=1314773 RepID=A0A3N2QA51_SODAK|nr:meiotic coiled-coil protein [Sodiomyces alkalinus F11]ROT43525.1 meiotic coiled-coil protein [Sodiomyces alkalinus F11]
MASTNPVGKAKPTTSTGKELKKLLDENKDADQPGVSILDNATKQSLTDKLLARLSEQEEALEKQRRVLKNTSGNTGFYTAAFDNGPTSSSVPVTPDIEDHIMRSPSTRPASAAHTDSHHGPSNAQSGPSKDAGGLDEVARLKMELARAKSQISRLDQELAQTRDITKEVQNELTSKPELSIEGEYIPRGPDIHRRDDFWGVCDEEHSDATNAIAGGASNRVGAPWGNSKGPWQGLNIAEPVPEPLSTANNWFAGSRGFNHGFMDPNGPYSMVDGSRTESMTPESDILMRPFAGRRTSHFSSRYSSPHPYSGSTYGGYSPAPSQFDAMAGPANGGPGSLVPSCNVGMNTYPSFNPQAIGTRLSPHATEFQTNVGWKDESTGAEGQTYLPTTEPLNYRRLLDRNANCNWKYIVDKIVCNNDQQASIFLQQKLKVGTSEQKYDIVEAIIAQAYPLMVNRFGNFLVQRCFEHGTPEQVVKIAEAIRGNTLNLSMDPFGCHVVQKAFDSVPEDYKAIMVHELLRRIPETVIHRYACHVWQKLFELRWSKSPPQIMKYVNEALRGMWHEVALGETGSLVVQNIFENCLEEDKRPCIEEVLANIDIVAHGQFGNWCIQHICEHGAPADRGRAVDHVIRYAAEYSTDQFASKVVEKCLKIGGTEFLTRYLDRVCEGRRDRPRIPLIDIASDQYGNYLIQYILTHASPQHREIVAAHIRKHMVSLRGSKFGSRVGMLCTNPAVTTRPGPGVGPAIPRMGGGNRGFGNPYR